jgi:hypothetical protein
MEADEKRPTRALETNAERRRRHLIALCHTYGRAEVARRCGTAEDYLRQIIAGTPMPTVRKDAAKKPKQVGDDLARAIEEGFSLPRGWMDNDHAAEIEGVGGQQLSAARALGLARMIAAYCDQLTVPMSHGEFVALLTSAVQGLGEEAGELEAQRETDRLLALMRYVRQARPADA